MLEPPDPAKGVWDTNFIRIDGNSPDVLVLVTEWLSTIEGGTSVRQLPISDIDAKQRELERQVTRDSRVYKYDQIFRTWVGHVAEINKQSTGTANLVRKKLLQEVRSGAGVSADIVIDTFCQDVCMGWSDNQVERLRVNLSASF